MNLCKTLLIVGDNKMYNFEIHNRTIEFRKNHGEDDTSPIDIIAIATTIPNLTVVYYPMGTSISGMCINGNKNCTIAINSNMSLGRQRFTMAHELYHYYYNSEKTTICSISTNKNNKTEQEADLFASFLLMPPIALKDKIKKQKQLSNNDTLSLKDIIAIEQYFQVSRQALLFRLVNLNEFTFDEIESFKRDIRINARLNGYNDDLYKPSPANKQYKTFGHYINMANDIYEHNEISTGKYEELLLSAFRADIVFGDEEDEEVGFFD